MTAARTPDRLYAEHIADFKKFMPLIFTAKDEFRARIQAGLKFKNSQHVDKKLALLEMDFFSEELLEALLSGGNSFAPLATHLIWQRLEEAKIVVKALGAMPNVLVDHHIDLGALSRHIVYDTLHNIFFPPANLPRRYQEAIVAVDVVKDGDERRGSGFVINNEKNNRDYIVTCRHNVDVLDGIDIKEISTVSGEKLEYADLVVSTKYDVAVMTLLKPTKGPPFYLGNDIEMFDDVYTLGYPSLPGALPVLLGHRGELNARAELYVEKCPALIISNLVSPGSSGCPVLNRAGRCVGMTIRWLEGEWGQEKMRFSAALPSAVIQEVLDTQL